MLLGIDQTDGSSGGANRDKKRQKDTWFLQPEALTDVRSSSFVNSQECTSFNPHRG
jgi:hypothetical protein